MRNNKAFSLGNTLDKIKKITVLVEEDQSPFTGEYFRPDYQITVLVEEHQ